MVKDYQSSRNPKIKASASEAILSGLSSDGGLFVLNNLEAYRYPIENLQDKNYQGIAQDIFQLFFKEFSTEEIKACVENAYDKKFTDSKIVPIKKLKEAYLLELFHGPTSAFKDIALSALPHLMEIALTLKKSSQKIMILTATSGDTGKAALEGFKDSSTVEIMVFYPNEGVSRMQQLQMQTQMGANVEVVAIKGNFDDAQRGIKELFNDQEVQQAYATKNYQLSSANSVNIGRLIPQIVYYFDAYRQLVQNNEIELGQHVDFVVPTGNFGNILAGYHAKKLGLPINQLICASNANHILSDFLATGIYDSRREFLKTTSPSMDILISSNLERLLFYVSGSDASYVSECMEQLKINGFFKVTPMILKQLQTDFGFGYATDEAVADVIQKVYQEEGYVLDPHTAVAYQVMLSNPSSPYPKVVLATASPYKFTKSVAQALKLPLTTKDEFSMIEELEKATGEKAPQNLKAVKNLPIRHQTCIEKVEMKNYVLNNKR